MRTLLEVGPGLIPLCYIDKYIDPDVYYILAEPDQDALPSLQRRYSKKQNFRVIDEDFRDVVALLASEGIHPDILAMSNVIGYHTNYDGGDPSNIIGTFCSVVQGFLAPGGQWLIRETNTPPDLNETIAAFGRNGYIPATSWSSNQAAEVFPSFRILFDAKS